MQFTLAILALAAIVKASPFPQAVTSAISPTDSAPPGCSPTFSGSFGIAVMNVSSSSMAKRQVTQLSDGQPLAASVTAAPVSQISDAQPQAPTAMMMAPVSMITDGQIQGGMHTMMMMPVSQIMDGQPQAATMTAVSQISDGQVQAMTVAPVTAMSDGQPQAPTMHMTASAVSQISDAQPQAPTASAVSQISDAQPQAPSATASAVSQVSDAQPQAATSSGAAVSSAASSAAPATSSAASSSGGAVMVACASNSTLALTLTNGVLTDAKGRTGYIAANYQFQFDAPPQAGAIFTSGFSVCGNGSLALGASNVFYQCLSGSFYNLYDRHWAAQCSPVTINTLMLKQCA